MQQQSLAPNVITYSALLSACEKGKQLEHAWETFLEMKRVFSNSLCPSGRAQFYSGYRKVNNQWLDQNTWKPLLGNIWEKNFPVNYPAYDCSYYSAGSNINQLHAHF